VVEHIEAAIRCMEAFDRAEQGPQIKRLPERCRYLIWHLQRVRARTIRGIEDINELFADRVVVELAPVAGSLDAGDDKIVQGVSGDCSIAVVVRRKLSRHYSNPNLAPTLLVEAVRCFDWKVIGDAMDHVVNERPRCLSHGARTSQRLGLAGLSQSAQYDLLGICEHPFRRCAWTRPTMREECDHPAVSFRTV
jgi:hypothetical protein